MAWTPPFVYVFFLDQELSLLPLLVVPIAWFRDLSSACTADCQVGRDPVGVQTEVSPYILISLGTIAVLPSFPAFLGGGFKNCALLDVLTLLNNKFIHEHIIYNF